MWLVIIALVWAMFLEVGMAIYIWKADPLDLVAWLTFLAWAGGFAVSLLSVVLLLAGVV